jgi:uncharacterized protein (TIGR02722 family)
MDTKAIRMGITIGLGAMLTAMGACMGGRSDGNWNVGRADPDADINLTYRFNENDARIIYEGMVEDALSKPWLDEWISQKGARPTVYVGRIRNDTEEYIDAELFTKRIEEELINSGRVRVVADQGQRAELREERIGQQEFSRPETIKKVANEIGADIALVGKIAQVFQQTNDRRTVSNYFQVSLELIDVETNEKLWIETEPVRKMATR